MTDTPTTETGPAVKSSKEYRHDLRRFNLLIDSMSIWRSEDHEDAMWLTRNQVIEIIEGVKELRRQAPKAGESRGD